MVLQKQEMISSFLDNEKEAKTLSENRIARTATEGRNPLTFASQDSAFSR